MIVGSNGSMLACHYVLYEGPGLKCRMVAKYIEGEGLTCPINMYFSDSSGTAEKMVIEAVKQ
jgi:hypothetical protein